MKEIQLTQGRVALVDDEDFPILHVHKWRCVCHERTFYAITNINHKTTYMHRLVMRVPDGQDIDHCNRDGLDNRRANLRFCTQKENEGNKGKQTTPCTSVYRGVTFDPRPKNQRHPWRAQIGISDKHISLGYYATEKEAALAYNQAAPDHFGEFAWLNDISEEDTE